MLTDEGYSKIPNEDFLNAFNKQEIIFSNEQHTFKQQESFGFT